MRAAGDVQQDHVHTLPPTSDRWDLDLPAYWKVKDLLEEGAHEAHRCTSGVPTKTPRYWEAEGLLQEPQRTAGRYRDYAPRDRREGRVHPPRLMAGGLTLRQIGEITAIREDSKPPCAHTAELVERRLADVEQLLRELRQTPHRAR